MYGGYVTAAYACAVGHFWVARAHRWQGLPAIMASFRFLVATPMVEEHILTDEDVLARVHDKRQQTLKAIASLWSLVLDLFLAVLFVSHFWSTSGGMNTLPMFCGVAAGNVILQRLSSPDLQLTPERLSRDNIIMTLLVFFSSFGLPREFLPALTMARVMISSFSTDAPLSNKLNFALAPFYILSHWYQNTTATSGDQLVFTVCSEGIVVSFLALAISNLDVKEYQLASAAIELEDKVKQVQEAERAGGAASRLLSVTCDASVRLAPDLSIFEPSQSLSDLLMCGFGSSLALNPLDGVPMIRYINPVDHQRFLDFIKESSNATNPARSLHVGMKDSSGVVFNAELFHVAVPGLRTDENEHLIGITQESCTDRLERFENVYDSHDGLGRLDTPHFPQQADAADMRHILGYQLDRQQRSLPSKCSRNSDSSGSSHSSGRTDNLTRLRSLNRVSIVVDVQTPNEDFLISSMELTFRHPQQEVGGVPNLMEWIKPSYRTSMFNYIQDHANASYGGRICAARPLRGIKMYSPMASAKTVLVGEARMESLEADGSDSENGGGSSPSPTSSAMPMRLELTNLFAH